METQCLQIKAYELEGKLKGQNRKNEKKNILKINDQGGKWKYIKGKCESF